MKTIIFGDKEESIDYRVRKGIYAVIFNEQQDKLATVQLTRGPIFLPGGGLEENERPEECLRREMLEETGHELLVGPYIGNVQQVYESSQNGPVVNDGHFYLAKIGEKVQEPIEEDHHLKWIPVNDAEKRLFHAHHIWAVQEGLKALPF
jgi:8-oxo-dGTP diphosphatase